MGASIRKSALRIVGTLLGGFLAVFMLWAAFAAGGSDYWSGERGGPAGHAHAAWEGLRELWEGRGAPAPKLVPPHQPCLPASPRAGPYSAPMGVTITLLMVFFSTLMMLWKVQHPSWAYAWLVAAFTIPIIWVPGLRRAAALRFAALLCRPPGQPSKRAACECACSLPTE